MEATTSPVDIQKEQEIIRKKILDNQYKCFEKMNRDPPFNKSGRDYLLKPILLSHLLCFRFLKAEVFVSWMPGLYCSRNWDGWLCWEDTPPGTYAYQNCPNYFDDFDPTGDT